MAIEASIRKGEMDMDILAPIFQDKDRGNEFFGTDRYYCYYKAIAHVFQPHSIAEIGIRFGYSLYAMAQGCLKAPMLYGFDDGCYESTWKEVSEASLKSSPLSRKAILYRWNTQTREDLPIGMVDLFHVDGCHTTDGALCDLYLALRHTRNRGLILLDDVDFLEQVREAKTIFQRILPINIYVPTSRGMQIFSVE